MSRDKDVKISKLLSFALRHRPQHLGITLDEQGWVPVDELLSGLAHRQVSLSRAELADLVARSDKQRFALSDDGQRIRASQGHSVEVELGYEPVSPPAMLFHGTSADRVESIRRAGLLKRKRHHVHLSSDRDTAHKVGARHGEAVVLEIDAERMHTDGCVFYVSANGVWLTDHVPAAYIR